MSATTSNPVVTARRLFVGCLLLALIFVSAGSRVADAEQQSSSAWPVKPEGGWPAEPEVGQIKRVALDGMAGHPWRERAWFHLVVPENYSPQKRWPICVVLHGGPGGNPDQVIGFFHRGLSDRGVISVYPNALAKQLLDWNYPHSGQYILSIIDQVSGTYRIDPQRIYLTGVSMGGGGTWVQGAVLNDVFAAIAPISGWYGASHSPDLRLLRTMPIYAMHGRKDPVVPAQRSRLAFEHLASLGRQVAIHRERPTAEQLAEADCIFREIAEASHNCFVPWKTRGGPELQLMVDWLFAQRRSKAADLVAAERKLAAYGRPFGWKLSEAPVGAYTQSSAGAADDAASDASDASDAVAADAPSSEQSDRIAALIDDLERGDLKATLSAHRELMKIGKPAVDPLIALARGSRSRTTRVRAVMMIHEIRKRAGENPPPKQVADDIPWTQPVAGIAMRVSVDRSIAVPGQLVWLRVDFRNVDDQPRPFAPLTRVDLPRSSGGRVEARLSRDREPDATSPTVQPKPYSAHPLLMTLKPGQTVTYRFRLNEKLHPQYQIMLMHDRENSQRAGLPLAEVTTINWLLPAGESTLRFTYFAAGRGLLKDAEADLTATVPLQIGHPDQAE